MSAATSTIPPSAPHRRLSTRRGSTSAPDPLGVHADINHHRPRSSTSTLTIVRVPNPVLPPPPTLNDPPSSPALNARRSIRRMGPASPPAADQPPGRLSFAFSSFAPSASAPGGPSSSSSPPASRAGADRSSSPSSSPRLRPVNTRHGSSSSSFTSKPRLSPEQLFELARNSTSPSALTLAQNQPHTSNSGASSPALSAHSPLLRPDSPTTSTTASSVQPATFTPMPHNIYLPFIERASEVNALISSPPDLKLFTLLAQTFPRTAPPADGPTDDSDSHFLPANPLSWSYQDLIHHLTRVDRDIVPDDIWAMAARKCILSHSELLWERIKGAIGIPPELDVDFDFTVDNDNVFDSDSSANTSDISDDEGRGPRGHWSDWDAEMDSPVLARNKRLSVEPPGYGLYIGKGPVDSPIAEAAFFKAHIEDKLEGWKASGTAPSAATDAPHQDSGDQTGDTTISPTPAGLRSPPAEDSSIVIGIMSPAESYLSIETLLAPSSSPGVLNPPPLSLTGGDGLGDIAEGAEEEEEEAEAPVGVSIPNATSVSHEPEEDPLDPLISPSQIQGIRISTSPNPVNLNSPPAGHSRPVSRQNSRASSFSSNVGPFQRTESSGSLAAARASLQLHAQQMEGTGSGYASSDAGDMSDSYETLGDRPSGNPLFPSNFARLALSPTLRANFSLHHGMPGKSHIRSSKTRAYSHGAAGVSGGPPGGLAGMRTSLGGAPEGESREPHTRKLANRQSWGAEQ